MRKTQENTAFLSSQISDVASFIKISEGFGFLFLLSWPKTSREKYFLEPISSHHRSTYKSNWAKSSNWVKATLKERAQHRKWNVDWLPSKVWFFQTIFVPSWQFELFFFFSDELLLLSKKLSLGNQYILLLPTSRGLDWRKNQLRK